MDLTLFMYTALKNDKASCYMSGEQNFVLLVVNAVLYIYILAQLSWMLMLSNFDWKWVCVMLVALLFVCAELEINN